MNGLPNENRIDTTLGELIEAVSEAVFESCDNGQEAYAVASLVLAEILKSSLNTDGSHEYAHGLTRKSYLH
jgi:hypothetical protein